MSVDIEIRRLDVAESPRVLSSNARLKPQHSVIRLLSFCLLIVIIASITSAAISFGLRSVNTSAYGAWNQLMQGKVNADIIISGSSRAAYHYDPRAIEAATGLRAFNIGRAGTQTDVQLAVLKAYLEHNKKPDLIVHNLDAFSFVTSKQVFDPALYIPYLGDREIYQPLLSINPELYKSRYLPLYGYVVDDMNLTWLTGLKALVGINPRQDYFLGFSPRDKTWTDDFGKYKQDHPDGVSFAVEPAGIQGLRDLAEICREKGIRLLFVYSPEYAEMQKLTKNRPQIFAEFHQLATEYNVPVWDYSNWERSDDRSVFYNSQHLNAQGAALFSQEFSRRLEEYLASQHPGQRDLQASAGPVPSKRSSR